MDKLETVIFDSPVVRIGTWRCPPWFPRFNDTGPTDEHLVVFPRTTVSIQHAGAEPVVADPNVVMFYNRGQHYHRKKLSERGDRCEWFAFPTATILDAIRPHDPAVVDREEDPFAFTHGPSTTRAYFLQRLVVKHVRESGASDRLFVEETMMAVLNQVITAAYEVRGSAAAPAREETQRAHAELVRAVKTLLAGRFREPLSLEDLAQEVHVSPYHLCRVFRRQTGITLQRYLNQIRLRTSLEGVAQADTSLTELGLDLGYASPSHFSTAFKRTFGVTPSAIRRSVSIRRLQEMSKILKA